MATGHDAHGWGCGLLLAAFFTAFVATGSVAAPGDAEPADTASEPAAAEATAPEQIAERREAVTRQLSAIESQLERAADDDLQTHLEEVRSRLRSIGALLEEQSVLATRPAPAPATVGDEPDPEPSVFALDRLLEARFELEQRQGRQSSGLDESREALSAAKEKLDAAETRRREARSELESAGGGDANTLAARTLRIRELASEAARERVHLRTLETRIAEEEIEGTGSPQALDERIAVLTDVLAREGATSDAGFSALAEREGELREQRRAIERRLARNELQLEAARSSFGSQPGSEALLEEVEGLTAIRDIIQREGALVDGQIARLSSQRMLWRQWEAALGPRSAEEPLEEWKASTAEQIESIEQVQLDRMGQRAEVERRLARLEARLATVPESAPGRSILEAQRASLVELLDAERIESGELARELRLSERFLATLRERTGESDPWNQVARGLEAVRGAWKYEITAVDDSPITVGSVFLALIFAIAGFWASRRGSALVGRAAAGRLRLDVGAVHALQTLSFYVLLVGFILLALRAIHFPLTAFTVLGGALAIGIGFGSQNVMNNFISGLILMLERPVRVRDVVEVDGNHGTIEHIGARSTQIRSTDGRHIIVPNSFFLESNVVNWTLSDDLVRTSVLVGVIYGSPTDLVAELIGRVAAAEDAVIRDPEPIVLFEEFGDNSLNFSVHFWVRARSPMQMRKVESRMRFRIDQLFREHDLVIAFPQRDVHLDSVSPIEVRMVERGRGEEPETE